MGKAKERKDDLIIAALLTHPTVKEASAACGVSETQIYARLRNDTAFIDRYNVARSEIVKQASGNVQAALGTAIEKVKSIMCDDTVSPQVQLNAADTLLRHSYRLTELSDVLERIDRLEAAARKVQE